MKNILLFAMLLSFAVLAGCTRHQTVIEEEVIVTDSPIDDQIVIDSMRRGVKLTSDYTTPATEAEAAARPDDLLYDSTGKPYKVVKHIGLND